MHSVASFIEPVIEHHDRSGFTVYCYYTRAETDATTERLAGRADAWRDARADSPDALAAKIHADGIDILVDLGGHTIGNSLAAFSRRPAPVQCTWLGYPDTTGLGPMDYRITDAIVDPPPEADALHCERLLRVAPPFVCYQPPLDAPPIQARPQTQGVVFGCFNVIMKVNEPLIASWARILSSVPHSRLVIKSTLLEYEETAARLRARCAAHGISPGRLELRRWADDRAEHLAAYNEIDIALDTYPYNGTTTTCEALWMGVPVVTLSGALHMSRVGETLLGCAGLHELVAKDPEQYVAIAVALARDTSRRAMLAAGMRQRVAASPLLDHAAFTKKLENAYRTAWNAWCETEVDTALAGSRTIAT
jgi:predicted O-linked N-acetylglucosamine transferase (SPINDLY family)